jgi:hypothetical protein
MANSIAYSIIRSAQRKSIHSHQRLLRENKLLNAEPDAIPPFPLWGAQRAQCADKSEVRKNDSGKEHTGKWGNEANGTARRMFPSRVRWKCVAGPYCRTFRNARNERTRLGRPTHKIAGRNSGTARGATE